MINRSLATVGLDCSIQSTSVLPSMMTSLTTDDQVAAVGAGDEDGVVVGEDDPLSKLQINLNDLTMVEMENQNVFCKLLRAVNC